MDKIGRKYTLLSIAIPHALSFICTGLGRSIYIFYLARIFSGLSEGCAFTALFTLVAEISTPKVRGSWGNTLTCSMYLGYPVINTIGGFVNVATAAWICITLPIIFAICLVFIPESPYYHLMRGKKAEARMSLLWFRRMEAVENELNEIENAVKKQMSETGTWMDLLTIKSNRRALIAAVFLRIAQQFSGIACFAVLTNLIFEKAGGNISARLSSIIFTTGVATANFITSFTVDKFGRRISVITSLVACFFILSSQSIFFYISLERPDIDTSSVSWFPLVGMIFYVPAHAIGLGIVPSLMLGELFAANVKAKGLCVANISFSLLVGGTSEMFQVLMENYGLYMPFAIFAGCCGVNSFIAYMIIPETRGKTLDEIQQALKGGRKDMFR